MSQMACLTYRYFFESKDTFFKTSITRKILFMNLHEMSRIMLGIFLIIYTLHGNQASAFAHLAIARRQENGTSSTIIQQLVAGIDYNIMAQNGEKAILSQMQSLVAAPTPDALLFRVAKDDLLSFMNCGSRVRSNNMNLSSVNAQVTRGLAQLEAIQVLQLAKANSLNGTTTDGPILDDLQSDVDEAIAKNRMLQAIATESA
ncbi:uncharacterized protein PV09_04352 [Verruconis gallopava]|uniref:Uncharacterized protein n=1 Tax=Verruconis gallopava TaxID=253628 RepID=A0A0D2AZT1_9PEZI|nr:uncharacterized protein PV09_04352 [Verruconis gallopava]KIW04604.1 hypothetical protein PV09_04352 [Verruconis gallopava]